MTIPGFQLQTSEPVTPDALERLVLIPALATAYFPSIGLGVIQAKVRRWVDTHWDRGLSNLKIAWRWLRQCYQHSGTCLLLFGSILHLT